VPLKLTLKYALLVALGIILTAATFVFGALPMRLVRRAYGRLPFWTGFVLVSGVLSAFVSHSYGWLVMALAVAVGVYSEVEEHGGSVFTSGFVATLASFGTAALGAAYWLYRTKAHLVDTLRAQLEPVVDRLTSMSSVNSSLTVETLMQQLPSGVLIGIIGALAIALIGEKRWMTWFGLQPLRPLINRVSSFRVPDLFIWITIVTIFGAFYKHGNSLAEVISINALNALAVIFFFQGLAIASQAFRTFKVGPFWRWLWYVVLVLQLFLLVSLVGFADFWLDFRERLTRKPAETKKIF
jgi:hypothetical protein